jgi:hypothetical protein
MSTRTVLLVLGVEGASDLPAEDQAGCLLFLNSRGENMIRAAEIQANQRLLRIKNTVEHLKVGLSIDPALAGAPKDNLRLFITATLTVAGGGSVRAHAAVSVTEEHPVPLVVGVLQVRIQEGIQRLRKEASDKAQTLHRVWEEVYQGVV